MVPDPSTERPRHLAAIVRALSRAARVALAALAAAGLAYAAALVVATRPAAERALRARIAAALTARLGPGVELGPEVSVDPVFRVTFGPVTARDPATGVALVELRKVKVRPRWTALLAGRVEPASVRLYGVRVELAPGRARPAAPRATPPPAAPAGAGDGAGDAAFPRVHLRDVVVAVTAAGRRLEVGPVDGGLTRSTDGDARVWSLALERGRARAAFTLRRGPDGLVADVRLARVPARRVPAPLLAGVATLEDGELGLEATARAPADLSRVDLTFAGSADGLVVAGERLGPEPVGPIAATARGAIELDRAARSLTLRDGVLELLGALRVGARGEARLGPGIPFSLALRAEDVDYRALAAALPPALALPADAPRPPGTFDASVELSGPLARPDEWAVAGGLELARMRAAARAEPPVALRGPFTHRPEVETGAAPVLRVAPGAPGFVAVADLPEHVIRAVTTSEDAGFFAHQGFDLEELKNAFVAGARKGRVVRGGSTITQQLAKNLFLTREKTLARKAREALLTVALESTVAKSRLLEIYLNVAEWGPGIWGLGAASRHYFGVEAKDLTPKQAAFLASIIPNPVRYHFMYARGALTEGWEQRVAELLLKMNEQGALDDDALIGALLEPVVFTGGEDVRTTAGPG